MSPRPGPREPARYELRVEEHLAEHWSTWFDGLTLVHEDDATTTLRVTVADQAELHGLLAKVRDIGATLISVRITTTPAAGPTGREASGTQPAVRVAE